MSEVRRRGLRLGIGALVAVMALGAPGCKRGDGDDEAKKGEAEDKATTAGAARTPDIAPAKLAAFPPLPESADLEDTTEERVALGQMLYHDERLSKNHDISCNSCHKLDAFGVDGEPTSPGHKGQRGDRNSPTVFNAALHFTQFWDGREPTVEAQAKGPVLNPVEMAMPEETRVVETLASMPGYVEAFAKAFPGEADPIHFDNMAKAIGAFERRLLTPARWDRFLKGEADALTDEEKIGFNAFLDAGCATCHSGPILGGQMFQKLGLVELWPNDKDLGRFQVTKSESDKMMFKVPSLRNVTKTAPYYHDGSIATLEEAIRLMAKHQVGRELSSEDIAAIATWLDALTAEPPRELLKRPELPASTDRTPAPDPT